MDDRILNGSNENKPWIKNTVKADAGLQMVPHTFENTQKLAEKHFEEDGKHDQICKAAGDCERNTDKIVFTVTGDIVEEGFYGA